MNIQTTKKLTSTLLACALMLGGAISASAAEPANKTVKVIASSEMTKSVLVGERMMTSGSSNPVQVQVIPIDEAASGGITISVVPKSKLVRLSDVKTFDKQDSVSAIRLVPAEIVANLVTVKANDEEASIKTIRLASAKTISIEKIIME